LKKIVIKPRRRAKLTKVALIGGGSWATALAKILADNNIKVNWWMRSADKISFIKKYHRNPKYLSSVDINTKRCRPTNNIKRVIRFSNYIILAVPAAFLDETLAKVKARQLSKKIIISGIKGIVPEGNLLVADYMLQKFEVPMSQFAVLGGPCHAEEIAQEKLSYLTVSSASESTAEKVVKLVDCRYVKAHPSNDVFGVEYAAVLKNIVAIASGICHGLGFGDNFQAVLISNAIQEIDKFITKVVPKQANGKPFKRDIRSSVYLGDLMVTTYSQFSRNRTFGNMIGKGYPVKSAQMEMDMVAEGYYAAKSIHEINKEFKVGMPITEAVYNILYEQTSPAFEMDMLAQKLN